MNRQSMQQNMQAITFDDIMFEEKFVEKNKNGISKSKSLQRDVEIYPNSGNDLYWYIHHGRNPWLKGKIT